MINKNLFTAASKVYKFVTKILNTFAKTKRTPDIWWVTDGLSHEQFTGRF